MIINTIEIFSNPALNDIDVTLLPQEMPCGSKFNGRPSMTRGFCDTFDGQSAASLVALKTHELIMKRVNSKEGADYLQIAKYNGIRFFVIDSDTYYTFLLPSEY